MEFDPELAAVRFGTGLSPRIPPPQDVAAMLAALAGPDAAAAEFPIPTSARVEPSLATLRELNRARRSAIGTADEAAGAAAFDAARLAVRDARLRHFGMMMARGARAQDGLRERLALFWADHFTVRPRDGFSLHLVAPYVEEAIRPHLTGRFADMLIAVTTHPMMLAYLDQGQSMGPNSPAAQRRDRGLNENLARELLELHTVGVGGPYDQRDVRELAELLTGLTWHPDRGTVFRPDFAEPGAETVLGLTFSAEPEEATVRAALQALATHPATAAYLARKIAVHFVADDPDPGLVAALEARHLDTGGDLLAVTEALLNHPAAWAPERRKVRQPVEFVMAGLRALDVPADRIVLADLRESRRLYQVPMAVMGQSWEAPPGPDGWPEAAEAWVTPQGMAGRIGWAMEMPARLIDPLPDPRDLVRAALGVLATEEVLFAAAAAEDRAEGIGVVLASAAFQRR